MTEFFTNLIDICLGKLFRKFCCGLVGGTMGVVMNNPLDVVVSRSRNATAGEANPYRWQWPSVYKIAQEEGIGALYKGFKPKVMRLGPGGGIMIVTFDFMSGYLIERKKKNQF